MMVVRDARGTAQDRTEAAISRTLRGVEVGNPLTFVDNMLAKQLENGALRCTALHRQTRIIDNKNGIFMRMCLKIGG
jgi:hypothetical protein